MAGWTNTWDKKHALVDHLSRATESILLNLAEAVRQRAEAARLQTADYAIGSSLECAGCLDLARVKEFLTPDRCQQEKRHLSEIAKMLIGLRKSWAHSKFREEPVSFSTKSKKDLPEPLFHHESLEVYRAALNFMEWFVSQSKVCELSNRLLRQLDEAGTSVALNIAEENGRYAELDHHRFLQIAQGAAVKASVYLDLAVKRELLGEAEADGGKKILRKIGIMVAGF